ncbi:hypothetical protein Btru_066211 [Bulinus truncatus]|nr:hypothetical protein Btru_066211 [Bulinus truncatus]
MESCIRVHSGTITSDLNSGERCESTIPSSARRPMHVIQCTQSSARRPIRHPVHTVQCTPSSTHSPVRSIQCTPSNSHQQCTQSSGRHPVHAIQCTPSSAQRPITMLERTILQGLKIKTLDRIIKYPPSSPH